MKSRSEVANDMVPHPRHGLSLCAGGAGLDMGLMLAEPGFHTRCFVEWEGYPRQSIISAQRAGYLAAAPIWDDVTTFDGQTFRGSFDTVLAGYPCQPFSHAGQRKGHDDERHLWPDVARIIREVEPEWVFLENVAGHVSLGAETVLRELRVMGFTPASGLFSAAEVGAAHERLRWFCAAHRDRGDGDWGWGGRPGWRPELADSGNPLGGPLEHAQVIGCREGRAEPEFRSGRDAATSSGGAVDNTAGPRCEDARRGSDERRDGIKRGEPMSGNGRGAVADSSSARAEARGANPQGRGEGIAGEPFDVRPLLHAPGPEEMDLWRFALNLAPDLAPAVSLGDVASVANVAAQMVAAGHMAEAQAESMVRRMAHGLASRSRALRLLGNGVFPLDAGYAWRTLAVAHGLRPVDLGAAA